MKNLKLLITFGIFISHFCSSGQINDTITVEGYYIKIYEKKDLKQYVNKLTIDSKTYEIVVNDSDILRVLKTIKDKKVDRLTLPCSEINSNTYTMLFKGFEKNDQINSNYNKSLNQLYMSKILGKKVLFEVYLIHGLWEKADAVTYRQRTLFHKNINYFTSINTDNTYPIYFCLSCQVDPIESSVEKKIKRLESY